MLATWSFTFVSNLPVSGATVRLCAFIFVAGRADWLTRFPPDIEGSLLEKGDSADAGQYFVCCLAFSAGVASLKWDTGRRAYGLGFL